MPPTSEEIARLARPEAFPGDPSARDGVVHVQTHLSHVFLTGERVYKLRKAVDLGFVRFAAREERNEDCLRELALNRRLAPGVYLGLAPLREGPDGGFGPVGEGLAGDVEHAVVMRRLPAGRDALSLLEAGCLAPEQLDRVAACVAAFHDRHGLGAPAPFTADAWRERVVAPVCDNFRVLGEHAGGVVPGELLSALRERERASRERALPHFESRRVLGRAVDGHGDLHLQHIWLEDAGAAPLLIDCIEFSERLRRIDGASEVAFTAMDLRYRGRADLAERFLRVYARDRDDYDLYAVIDWFASYRAGVRAKVAAIAASEPEIDAAQRERAAQSVERHLELACASLEARPPGPLVLVGGVVGTGKSSASGVLAEVLDAVVVSSDRVRKRLAGMAPTERREGGWREGLYHPAQTERTYAGLLARARTVLASGRPAVLDATWARRALRQQARSLADSLGAPCVFVEAHCAPDVARARLARRAAGGGDPSDAGPEHYRASVAAFEPLDDDCEGERILLHTDAEDWRGTLRRLALELRR